MYYNQVVSTYISGREVSIALGNRQITEDEEEEEEGEKGGGEREEEEEGEEKEVGKGGEGSRKEEEKVKERSWNRVALAQRISSIKGVL